jgi:hypothetical protein
MALLEALYDNFSDSTASATKWNAAGSVAITGGVATLTGSATTSSLESASVYSFGATASQTHICAKVALSGGATIFEMQAWESTGPAKMIIRINGANLERTRVNISNAVSTAVLAPYDPVAMAYLRLRNDSTNCYFGYSADGLTWTEPGSSPLSYNSDANIKARLVHGTTDPAHIITIDVVNYPPISALTEDFSAGVLDTTKWTTTTPAGANYTLTGGAFNINTIAGQTTTDSALTLATTTVYAIGDQAAYAKITPTADATQTIAMRLRGGSDQIYMYKLGTLLYLQLHDGASLTYNVNVAYNPTTMAWWRIRRAVTNTLYETSPDGNTWTQRGTKGYITKSPFVYTLEFNSTFSGTSSATTATIDSINTPAPITIAPDGATGPETIGSPSLSFGSATVGPIETLSDPFNGTTLNLSRWKTDHVAGSHTVSGGLLTLTVATAGATDRAQIVSAANNYQLSGSSITAKLTPSPATNTETGLIVANTAGVGVSGLATIRFIGIYASCTLFLSSGATGLDQVTSNYVAADWAYVRIRQDPAQGTVYFDRSTDGITWVQQASTPAPGWGAVVEARLKVSNWNDLVSGTRTGTFDWVNYPAKLATLTDDFTGTTFDASNWTVSTQSGGTAAVAGGIATFTTTNAAADSLARISSVTTDYNAIGSSITAYFVTPSPTTGVMTALTIHSGANSLTLCQLDGGLYWFLNNNAPTGIDWYTAATMKHWRILVAADGQVSCQYSANTTTWTGGAVGNIAAWAGSVGVRFDTRNNNVIAAGSSKLDSINMLPVRAPINTLTEDFPGAALDTVKWRETSTAGNTATIAGGILSLTVNTIGLNDKAEIVSVDTFDLAGGAVYIRVDPCTVVGMFTTLQVHGSDTTGYALIGYYEGAMYRRVFNATGGGLLDVNSPFVAGDWNYWRIRMDATATNIYFDRSPDATTWTQVSTAANPGWGRDVQVRLNLHVATPTGGAGAKTATYDTVNLIALPPPVPIAPDGFTDTGVLGDPSLTFVSGDITVSPTGIGALETFGDPTLTQAGSANASYQAFRDGIMGNDYNLITGVVKIALVKGYTYDASDQYLSDVTAAGGVINGVSTPLTTPTITAACYDADDTAIPTTADPAPHVLIGYQASNPTGGADLPPNQQRLMWYFDTGIGLPVTPGAGTVAVIWPDTAGKIYKIGL